MDAWTQQYISHPLLAGQPVLPPPKADVAQRAWYVASRDASPPGAWTDDRLQQSYHFRGVIYVALKAMMDGMAGAVAQLTRPRKVQKDIQGGVLLKALNTPGMHASDNDRVPVPESHFMAELLEYPNPQQSFNELAAEIVMQRGLTGRALVWAVPSITGPPCRLYVMPTALCQFQPVSPYYPNGGWRVQQYYPSGSLVSFPGALAAAGAIVPAEQIVRIDNPHPLWWWDAFSTLTACGVQFDVLEAIDRSRHSIANKAVRAGMVVTIPGLSKDDVDAMKGSIDNRMAGPDNAGNTLVFSPPDGAAKTSVEFPIPNAKDLDNIEGWNQMVELVLAAYRVPKAVAGLAGVSSYAELYAAQKQFHTYCLKPEADKIAAALTRYLCKPIDRRLKLQIDLPKIDDVDAMEKQNDSGAQYSTMLVNEIRASRNQKPLPDGDVPPKIYEAKMMQAVAPQPAAPQPDDGQQPAEPDAEVPPMDAGQVPDAVTQSVLDSLGVPSDNTQPAFGKAIMAQLVGKGAGVRTDKRGRKYKLDANGKRIPIGDNSKPAAKRPAAADPTGIASKVPGWESMSDAEIAQQLGFPSAAVAKQPMTALTQAIPTLAKQAQQPQVRDVLSKADQWADAQAAKHAAKVAQHLRIPPQQAQQLLSKMIRYAAKAALEHGTATATIHGDDGKELGFTVQHKPTQQRKAAERPSVPRPDNPDSEGSLPPRPGLRKALDAAYGANGNGHANGYDKSLGDVFRRWKRKLTGGATEEPLGTFPLSERFNGHG